MKIWPKFKFGKESVWTLLRITCLVHRKSYLVTTDPNSHAKLTKCEIRQSWSRFEHCSESLICSLQKVISGHYLPQFTWQVNEKWNLVKLQLIQTLVRITRLVHRKSYLVIICPNSHEKLTKSEIMSSWSRFEHCSESLIWAIGSHIWKLFSPIHMKSWPKVKWGRIGSRFKHCSKSLV